MSKIRVMNKALSSRIAAGEVIERPASVVKELVENALDAGATSIEVEIERAGTKLISVTDNGCGMDKEDAMLALEQHGTSKLLCEEDLNTIMTLGFRGEALPSIASVSKFTMTTRTADSIEGSRICCNGGETPELSPCSASVGTRIEVRDLFYNLPARKKFLKSAATEEHHIEEMISLLAISHPETGFKLLIDKRTVFNSPASGKLEYRLREIFGKSFIEKMLFFEHRENSMYISGCIAAPGFTRPSRKDQRVFINSRAVEALAVYRGIREGYATLAETGRYNPVIIFIEMPPDELDVNVHPAKREVRFRSEYTVSRAIAAAVSAALRQMRDPRSSGFAAVNAPSSISDGADAAAPQTLIEADGLPLSGKIPLSMVLDAAEVSYRLPEKEQISLPVIDNKPIPVSVMPVIKAEPAQAADDTFSGKSEITQNETEPLLVDMDNPPPDDPPPFLAHRTGTGTAAFTGDWPHRIIGALDNTFILCEGKSGLIIIDQHAAHERVMFESILAEAEQGKAIRQQLLIPETVELPRSMVPLLLKNHKIFEQLGFDVESAGGCTILVNALPFSLGGACDIATLFADMLHEILENSGKKLPVNLEYVARAACKAAVKAHDVLSPEALEILLANLRDCRQGTLCPHGRPTMITVSFSELEKRFGRR